MDRDQYLGVAVENGAAIARASQTAPDVRVPSCPDWRLRDLGFHVACVLSFWADVVRRAGRKPQPLGSGMTPPADTELERFVRTALDTAVAVLGDGVDDMPAWNWWEEPTARGIPRLIAHETTVHRWDATNALGEPDPLDPALAADGVLEFYNVLMPGSRVPPDGLAGSVALEPTDVDVRWLVTVEPRTLPTITSTSTTTRTRASVRGNAAHLLLLLWRRLPLEAVDTSGDRAFVRRLIEYPNLD